MYEMMDNPAKKASGMRHYSHYPLSIRAFNLYGFIACCALLAISAYFQQVLALEPCALCLVQRYLILVLAALFAVGMFYRLASSAWTIIHNFVIFCVSTFGATVAGRHVYLQSLPPSEAPACGPSLDYMLTNMPFKDTLYSLFHAAGDCAEITWQLFGWSIPMWTLVFFAAFALVALVNIKRA